MAEHLHGYPRCETPVGTSCTSSDLHFDECGNHGAIRSCEASVVDGIPTGQYRCMHDDAAAPAKKAAGKAKARPKKAAKGKAKPKKKAASKGKGKAKGKAKKAARKPAKKSRAVGKKKGKAKGGRRKGARKKK